MKNSRILLSALTACVLFSNVFGYIISGGKTGNTQNPAQESDYTGVNSQGEYTNSNGKVTIISGDAGQLIYFNIYGGYFGLSKYEQVINNIVTISGGDVGILYGGYGKNVVGNIVSMSGGTAGKLYGGYGNDTAVDGNIVSISGGSAWFLYGGFGSNSAMKENSVKISGNAVINGDVYGVGSYGQSSAINNTVIYSGGTIKGDIYGGYAKTSRDNKLVIAGTNLSARSVIGNTFQIYSFSLPASIKANDVMLKLTNPLKFETQDTLEFSAQGKLDGLKLNDRITLIDKVSNYLLGKYYILAEYNSAAVKYYYGFNLEVIDEQLTATLINNNGLKEPEIKPNGPVLMAVKSPSNANNSVEDLKKLGYTLDEIKEILQAINGMDDVGNAIKVVVNQEAKSLSEGSSASMATLNSASDTIAGKATESAVANANANGGADIGNFGAIGAGSNRYKTGSYVDSRSVNLVAGIALGKELNYGKLVVGPFLEFGYSDYETHNDFSTGHVKGDGTGKYYGIGALFRYDLNDFKGSRPYVEFSARFGRNKNDFSNDIGADYDVSSNYYGLHAGLGYIIASGANSFDIYGKYFFTHLNGTDTTLATGENFAFDAVKSHKTRLGIKYSKEIELASGNIIAPYIGAGWEKEYSGDAKATTTPAGSNIGFAVSAPSLKGNSAMAEIGVNIGKEKGFKADIGLTGYAGIHRGVNANLILQYEF